jgi:hypothetical protein
LPLDFTAAIISERFCFETLSVISIKYKFYEYYLLLMLSLGEYATK